MDKQIQIDSIFGDPLQTWPPVFGTPTNILARAVPGKLIGIIMDPDALTGEYETLEVV